MKLQGEALEQMAAAYALGSLGVRARRRFETQLQQDVHARRSWQQWEQTLSALAQDLPPVRPPDNSWSKIEQRIARPPATQRRPGGWLIMAALLVLAIVAVWMWLRAA